LIRKKKIHSYLLASLLALGAFCACEDDNKDNNSGSKSSAAGILEFTIESDVVTSAPVVDVETGRISFAVSDAATSEQLKLAPVIKVSDNATVTPASGEVQDFSKAVAYTVVAEDGTVKKYSTVVSRQNVLKFTFDEWVSVGESQAKHDEPMPQDSLASSVQGASLLFLFGVNGFPVYKTEDKVAGEYAIKLVSMNTSKAASELVPALTAGSVFTGKFDMGPAFTDKLKCTKFGIVYDKKPLRFKGWYKYTPGKYFIDGTDYKQIDTISNKVDQCVVQAILYKVSSYSEYLDGHDINTSDKRVAVAALPDGSAKSEYTQFDIPFEWLDGKSYEEGVMYKLAIVCSSSKEGDYFKGAGESTLFLDEIEVIGK